MRRLFPILLLLIAARALHAQSGDRYAGSFLEIPLGAKALGLGGAFTAIADDGTGFFWNPAGVGLLENKLLSGMYSSQFGSLGSPLANYYFAGWSMPVSGFGLSANWIRFAVSDIPYYDDLTDLSRFPSVESRYRQARQAAGGEVFSDTEDAFIFSFARNNKIDFDLGWSYFSIPLEIPIGVNLKMIRQNLYENTASAIGIDAGAMLRLNLKDLFFSDDWPMLSLAFAIKDIGGTNLSWAQTQRTQEIPQKLSYGIAITQPVRPLDGRLVLSGDITRVYTNEVSVGAEFQYKRQFSFRLGTNASTLTVGAGVDFNFFDVDYAYLASSQTQLGQVHRLSLAFNFDKLLEKSPK